jgi:hypothetical protein
MGGAFMPPGHPNHTHEVRQHGGTMTIEYCAYECDWIDVTTRTRCRSLIDTWKKRKPCIDAPEVQEWIGEVMRHFARCYNDGKHAGVACIQRYYPEFSPTEDEIVELQGALIDPKMDITPEPTKSPQELGQAVVTETIDTAYKAGSVTCACGWSKELGDGFNQHRIASCPGCDPEITTRNQERVTTGRLGNYKTTTGRHIYFVLSNGLHIQHSRQVYNTQYSQRSR